MKRAYYIIDGLTNQLRANAFKKALMVVNTVTDVKCDTIGSMAEITFIGKKPEESIHIACEAVGLRYRTEVKKRDARDAFFY